MPAQMQYAARSVGDNQCYFVALDEWAVRPVVRQRVGDEGSDRFQQSYIATRELGDVGRSAELQSPEMMSVI